MTTATEERVEQSTTSAHAPVHGACATCLPDVGIGDTVTAFCGVPKVIRSGPTPISQVFNPCVVCFELRREHNAIHHKERP